MGCIPGRAFRRGGPTGGLFFETSKLILHKNPVNVLLVFVGLSYLHEAVLQQWMASRMSCTTLRLHMSVGRFSKKVPDKATKLNI